MAGGTEGGNRQRAATIVDVAEALITAADLFGDGR